MSLDDEYRRVPLAYQRACPPEFISPAVLAEMEERATRAEAEVARLEKELAAAVHLIAALKEVK
jgi:hypothetical protein